MAVNQEATVKIKTETDVKAVEELDKSVKELGATVTEVGKDAGNAQTGLTGFGTVAQRAGAGATSMGASFRGSRTSLVAFSTSLQAFNPQAASALSAVGNLSGAIGYLPALINPAALGFMALAGATAAATYAFKKSREEIKKVEDQTKTYIDLNNKLKESLAEVAKSLQENIQSFDQWITKFKGAKEFMEEFYQQTVEDNALTALEAVRHETGVLGAELKSLEKAYKSLGGQLENAQDRLERAENAGRFEKHNKKALAREVENLAAKYEYMGLNVEQTRKRFEESSETLIRMGKAYKLALDNNMELADEGKKSSGYVKKQRTDWAALADQMFKTALVSEDFGKVMDNLKHKNLGPYLVEHMARAGDQLTSINGLTIDQINLSAEIRKEYADSGTMMSILAQEHEEYLEQLREEARIKKEYDEWNQKILEEHREQERLQQEYLDGIEYMRHTYEERLEYEQELIDKANEKLRIGLQINDEERAALTELYDNMRKEEEDMAKMRERKMEAFSQQLDEVNKSAVGLSLGNFAADLSEAAAAGDDMGEALGEAGKKAIANLAKQYGSFFVMQGTGWLFTPGMQAQGAGLIAAGTALMAIGGAVGALGGSKSKGVDDQAGSYEENRSVVIETTERRSAGKRARDTGRDMDKADRYGIDRERSWA